MNLDRIKQPALFPWFGLSLIGLFLGSIALRFWGLSRFNTLVFDEVYFAKFASHYLKGIPLFEGHPPLSTYILALGVWIAEHTPLGDGVPKNGLTGLYLSPFSYRWMNALTGSLLPLVVAGIAYQLSHRRSYALMAGLFLALDGLFLIESRYALINVYLILFGLLGHWFFLIGLNQPRQRQRWLCLAGVCLGASPAIKWNGLGYLFGIYLVWGAAWVIWGVRSYLHKTDTSRLVERSRSHPLQSLTQINLGHMLIYLGLVPALIYYVSWIPFIRLDPSTNFWQWQARIIDYHHRVGGMNVHPYCSPWYSWIVMWRPVAYFYETSRAIGESPAIVGPPLPQDAGIVAYDVQAMGNPILWWLSTAAILILLGLLVEPIWRRLRSEQRPVGTMSASLAIAPTWTAFYLVANWVANLLPWLEVTRCVFLYHYMESLVFSFLALALVIDRWLYSPLSWRQIAGITTIFLIAIAFMFWLPFYLGLPLSSQGMMIRRWFPSWI
jgi:dolichyl-phosphate-mannose-protein mannosyltransferase